MTVRQLYEYVLIELNKVQAPSILLEDFVYFCNKAINQYSNKIYNAYDITQQKTDDLRVLKSTAILIPNIAEQLGSNSLYYNIYEVNLPDDYVHILNCVVEYSVEHNYKCYKGGELIQFGAKRLTADMFPQIMSNYYMKPSYKNPYFYINNVNSKDTFVTTDYQVSITQKVDLHLQPEWTSYTDYFIDNLMKVSYDGNNVVFYKCISNHTSDLLFDETYAEGKFIMIGSANKDSESNWTPFWYTIPGTIQQKIAEQRYGNKSKVRMEIRYGKDPIFLLTKVYVDYLRSPQYVTLTYDQLDEVSDNSQILEFPDYVCQEITNELVKLILENASDPRLQTNIPVSQSIASPEQVQQKR